MMRVNTFKDFKVLPKPVFTELPETYTLSQEQFKFYDDNGFVVIKEFIDFASLYSYKQRFTQICNGVVPKGSVTVVKEPSLVDKQLKPENYVNKIQDILYDDILITYGENPRMLHVLSQLIGEDITAVHSMFINKPPGTGRHPPHQDLFYFPFRPAEKIIGAWTAVDHVNLDNGCLYVLPGSHKEKVLHPHGILPDSNKLYHGILNEDLFAPVDKRIHLDMSPGDTVFFHPFLVHGSGPNISKNYRKAITFHFANSSCHYIDVQGTVQEDVAKDIEKEALRRGFEVSFVDIMRYRARQIKGVRSNL